MVLVQGQGQVWVWVLVWVLVWVQVWVRVWVRVRVRVLGQVQERIQPHRFLQMYSGRPVQSRSTHMH